LSKRGKQIIQLFEQQFKNMDYLARPRF